MDKEILIQILAEVRDALNNAENCKEAADVLDDRVNSLRRD